MEEIHRLCEKLREDPKGFLKLASEIKVKFACDGLSFGESCEALACLLYFSLLWDISTYNVKSVVHEFILKWFDHNGDLNNVKSYVSPSQKISSFGSVLLLYNHVFQSSTDTHDFSDILTWKTQEPTPLWLAECISSHANGFELMNNILVQSLNHHNPVLEICNDYVKPLSLFLNACHNYLLRNYDESIQILSSIREENCSTFLLGMVNLFVGLNLQWRGKLQSSLIKYKYSFGCSNNCWLSIYLAARIFRNLNKMDASIEALKLLRQVNIEEEYRDLSFHGLLLHYHFPKEPHFQMTAEWLLGTNYLEQQRYNKAQEQLSKVYLQHPRVTNLSSSKKSLLLKADQFPNLPDFDCIRMEYAISLMHLREYEKTEVILKEIEVVFNQDEVNLDDYKELNMLAKAVIQLLSAEASFHLSKLDLSKDSCAKLVFYFEMLSYSPSKVWANIYNLVKSCLYKLIATIANIQNEKDKAAHYRRLERQSMDLWQKDDNFLLAENLNDDCKWIFQNIINYYKIFNC